MSFTYKSLVLGLVLQYLLGRLVLAHSCAFVFVCFFFLVGGGKGGGGKLYLYLPLCYFTSESSSTFPSESNIGGPHKLRDRL